MKKIILTSLLITLATVLFPQTSYTVGTGPNAYVVTVDARARKFFKTYEDYKSGKAVEGITLKELKPSSIRYVENGTEQKVKGSKLPYGWFCNEDGMLMRVFDDDVYYVVVDGPLCFYIRRKDGQVQGPNNRDYLISGNLSDTYPSEYYSVTPNGPIEKLKEKNLEEYLEKYNLQEAYDKDPQYRREARDCVMCWQNKKTNKQIKYIKLINEKMK